MTPSLLTSLIFLFLQGAAPQSNYQPDHPPQVHEPGCQSTESDPDADCIFGMAGRDYPTLSKAPETVFRCTELLPGIYADPEAACQVYHMCLHDGSKYTFLCPNGTVFNQAYFICDLWFNVDCDKAKDFYVLNENIYKEPGDDKDD